MNSIELYKIIMNELGMDETIIHPIHKAILEECCEGAVNNPQKVDDIETLKFAAMVSFTTALETVKATLKGLIEDSDQITLNYRNQTFIIPKDSKLLN